MNILSGCEWLTIHNHIDHHYLRSQDDNDDDNDEIPLYISAALGPFSLVTFISRSLDHRATNRVKSSRSFDLDYATTKPSLLNL